MDFDTAVAKHVPVDLATTGDTFVPGIVLFYNRNIIAITPIFRRRVDGVTFVKTSDYPEFRVWPQAEVKKIRNISVFKKYQERFLPDEWNSFYSILKRMQESQELVSVWNDGDDDYYVGKVISTGKKELKLKLVDRDATWIEPKRIVKMDSIDQLGAFTSYERKLERRI